MMDRIVHRGPDDAGTYRDNHAALGFRRLSIVDLAGGHQPLSNEDGTVWTVFNGEIYNFPALRHRLEARGHTLRSKGDTEVLVHLYEDEGTGMFALLRGHVRPGDLGRPPAHADPGPRPAGAEAAGLSARRLAPGLRQRAQGAAGPARAGRPPPGRSAGRRRVPDLRLRAPPADDPRGGEQAAPGPLRGLARRDAQDRPLLEPGLEPRAAAGRSRTTSRSSARPWPTPSASR